MTMTEPDLSTPDGLKKLAATTGPCITIAVPSTDGRDVRVRVKEALQQVKQNLAKYNGSVDADALLAPLAQIAGTPADGPAKRGTLVALRSPDVFGQFWAQEGLPEIVDVGEQFHFRTILSIAAAQRHFYLLALSQGRTRVLRCTGSTSEEMPLPPGVPPSLHEAMQTRKPDHVLDNRSTGGPSTGSMKGVMFGTSSDGDHKDEYLLHFFAEIDKGIHTLLKGGQEPLVVVATEHELAIYRQVNTYQHLVEPGVHGAPDGLKGGEMHRRALELLETRTADPVRAALENFDKRVGTGHASTHIRDIIKAAVEGRVAQLFFQAGAQYPGSFDEVRQRVKRADADRVEPQQDLIEFAAVETIRHGGQAAILPADKMPQGVPVCAVFRYPDPEA